MVIEPTLSHGLNRIQIADADSLLGQFVAWRRGFGDDVGFGTVQSFASLARASASGKKKWTVARPFSRGRVLAGASRQLLLRHLDHFPNHMASDGAALPGGNVAPVAVVGTLQAQFVRDLVLELVQGALRAANQRAIAGAATLCHLFSPPL